MTPLLSAALLLGICSGLLWIRTGVSIFLWISRAALNLEAIRLQAWSSIAVACGDFKHNYAARLALVRDSEVNR